jgi:hypothetical protein
MQGSMCHHSPCIFQMLLLIVTFAIPRVTVTLPGTLLKCYARLTGSGS